MVPVVEVQNNVFFNPQSHYMSCASICSTRVPGRSTVTDATECSNPGAILVTQNHILHVVPDTRNLYVYQYNFGVLSDRAILKTRNPNCAVVFFNPT
jgi:hypothetical protein